MDDSSGKATTMEATGEQSTPPVPDTSPAVFGTETGTDNKLYAVLGYIVPFLFFLPLLSASLKNDPFAKFHANQQLNLLLVCGAFVVIQNILYLILYFVAFALIPLIWLTLLVMAIIGIMNAVQGETKELPFIGKYRFLK